jgi:hypothetical protein
MVRRCLLTLVLMRTLVRRLNVRVAIRILTNDKIRGTGDTAGRNMQSDAEHHCQSLGDSPGHDVRNSKLSFVTRQEMETGDHTSTDNHFSITDVITEIQCGC